MTFDHIAFNLAGVTRGHVLRDAAVQLVPDQQRPKAAFSCYGKTVFFQDVDLSRTAPAIGIFHHVDGRLFFSPNCEWRSDE